MKSDEVTFDISEEIKALIPEERLNDFVETFSQIDTNNDGKIEIDEFLNAALTEEKIRLTRIFEFTDADKDGCIKFEEFVAVKEPKFQILKKFRALDIDRNGLLSLEEAIAIADQLNLPFGSTQVENIIHEVDQDNDGQVTYYEYLGAVAHIGFQ